MIRIDAHLPMCSLCSFSDVALKEFLCHLDSKTQHTFILEILDDQHLLIRNTAETLDYVMREVERWHDQNSFTEDLFDD